MSMLLPPYSIHETLHALRFFAGMNQIEMAQCLGMTQGWLSRIEAGTGDITVSHLLLLRNHFGLSADAVIDGTIPYQQIAERFGTKIKLPPKYQDQPATRVRILYGFVHHYEKKLGRDAVIDMFDDLHVPNELLAEPNFPINIRLFADVVQFGISQSVFEQAGAWKEVAEHNLSPLTLGNHLSALVKISSPQELFRRLLELSSYFTRDFDYTIRNVKNKSLEISVIGSQNVRGLKKNEQIFIDAMSKYKAALFKIAGERFFETPLKIQPETAGLESKELRYHVSW